MEKVMLTCFKANAGALGLYRKLHYSIDDTSPASDIDDPECSGYATLLTRLCAPAILRTCCAAQCCLCISAVPQTLQVFM